MAAILDEGLIKEIEMSEQEKWYRVSKYDTSLKYCHSGIPERVTNSYLIFSSDRREKIVTSWSVWYKGEAAAQQAIDSHIKANESAKVRDLKRNAANELYAALENMRNFMAYKYGDNDPYVKDADNALAKARGES